MKMIFMVLLVVLTSSVCVMSAGKKTATFYQAEEDDDITISWNSSIKTNMSIDKDALRDGRIRLHVSRLWTEDSGNYWCDLFANYKKITRKRALGTTEHFVLKVTSRGENRGQEGHNIITADSTKDAEHTAGGPKKEVTKNVSDSSHQRNIDQHQDRPAIIELVTEINTVHRLSN